MGSLLEGKVAIVTGGASGIGRSTARLFVGEGARVVIADILDDKGWQLAEELGPNACYQHTDVTQEADVRAAVERAVATFGGRLDCMFNNAGAGGAMGRLEEITVEGFDATVAVLLRGVFLGIKHAASVMKRQGSGSIISTASATALRAGIGPHIYSTAKAAVVHLTRCAAVELGAQGVRVNCIVPGNTATPIFGRALGMPDETAERTVGQLRALLARAQPIGRAGLPEDIAQAALYLASEESSFVNGHALVVDGGLSCGVPWTRSEALFERIRAVVMEAATKSDGGDRPRSPD
jgi:NAD(P)-dependent dehydrogenase (short-subunit alcohol dehydrogenase family)